MTSTQPTTRCPICGGALGQGRTTFTAELGSGVVVVRSVPATICAQCGEEWIDDAVAADLDRAVQGARARGAQVEVISLP